MTTVPSYDAEQLGALLAIIGDVDAVELKLTVPRADHRRTLGALGIDSLDAEIRQVAFVDTPDQRLFDAGLVVRARRTQRKPGDLTVKLRPMLPDEAPPGLREHPSFKVEVDASPQGFTCSCSLTAEVSDHKVRRLLAGEAMLTDLLDPRQRSLLVERLPDGVTEADLRVLGPLTLLKAKFAPEDFARKLVAELWFLPDGSRILELSTKATPAEAFQVAAETKVFLAGRGLDLGAPQETKTRTALAALAAALEKEQS
jgi:hypothetical protein